MKKNVTSKSFLFVDTGVLYDVLNGNNIIQTLEPLKNSLDRNKLILLLPDVIESEIRYSFFSSRNISVRQAAGQLSIDNLLLQNTQTTDQVSNQNKARGRTYDGGIVPNRETLEKSIGHFSGDITDTISNHYNLAWDTILKVLRHKNTILIESSGEIILNGIRRSLLKLSPYTNISSKSTENRHTKDIDCIAFEAIVKYLKLNKASKKDTLYLLVNDKDYFDESDKMLSTDIYDSLKFINVVNFRSIIDFNKRGSDKTFSVISDESVNI